MKRVGVLMGICLLLAFALGLSAQQNAGDDEAIRKLYGDFFETFRQAGPQGAAGYLRSSGTIDEEVLRELEREAPARLLLNPLIGRPDSWAMVREAGIPQLPRYRTVYAVTHHGGRPVAWRMRFYRKVTGVWVFTDVGWESNFVEDFLLLPEVEFAAYRRMLARTPATTSRE